MEVTPGLLFNILVGIPDDVKIWNPVTTNDVKRRNPGE